MSCADRQDDLTTRQSGRSLNLPPISVLAPPIEKSCHQVNLRRAKLSQLQSAAKPFSFRFELFPPPSSFSKVKGTESIAFRMFWKGSVSCPGSCELWERSIINSISTRLCLVMSGEKMGHATQGDVHWDGREMEICIVLEGRAMEGPYLRG
ncbi:hypothetical protein RRG08_053151 [Elysia crispata]|uniref:Uncharacterized protein n=1 Tax=Elysia crispata TaxID=231223 RepID=A0AAE1A8I8_9GAST|nr:hypothetical protein RRG08_053151 [Elysia crispata]